jgi:hypothetical protein
MTFLIQIFPRWGLKSLAKWVSVGGIFALGLGGFCAGDRAMAAENVVLTYGVFNETVSVESLQTLVETGETTASLDFLFNVMNITPEQARSTLTQDVEVSVNFIDDVFYSLPGEFVLFQMGQVFHNKARRANIQALRSSLILSASEDNNLTLLEFFEKYPNETLYVDGMLLADVANDVSDFVERTGNSLAVPIAIVKDLLGSVVCDCGTQSILPEEGSNTP